MKIWTQRKVYINYILWRLGLRDILPNIIVNNKKICENNSPLVNIIDNPRFSFPERSTRRGGCWVRAELVPMLERAGDNLPDGYKLHIFGGWRSITVQWTAWLKNLENKKLENPNLPIDAIKNIARKTSASPENGYGPHQTGGAIDLTVVDTNGNELDMGTRFSDHSVRSTTKYKHISDTAKSNRQMLVQAMNAAGFLNYPGEWWHYSYGDRAWATYKRKRCALFDRVMCKNYKLDSEDLEILKSNNIHIKPGE